MNCKLFVRTNRGVFLTPEGERLYTRVAASMIQLQLAEEELADSVGLEHGSISIGASEIALNIYLLQRLKNFHMSYPGVRLKLCNHSTPQAVRSVKSGEIDFAIVTTPLDYDMSLKVVRLKEFNDVLVGGRSFYGLGSHKLGISDIKKYPFICLGKDTTTYEFYYNLFNKHGVELTPDTEAATTDQVLPLVESELGLAFLPEEMVEKALKNNDIVKLELDEDIPRRYVCMIYDSKRPISVAAQKFKKILLEESNM